jgi:hypothetical protein
MAMLNKITVALALAMAIITVVPAFVGTSFARQSTQTSDGYYYQNGTLYYHGYPACQWGEATC